MPDQPTDAGRDRELVDRVLNAGVLNAREATLAAIRQARAEGARQERAKADEGALEGIARQYHELLYAVANKHPGETRHETALRYIRQAEAPCNEAKARAREPREEPTNG